MNAQAVSLADAADQLGVHYMTAYRYVRTGRMVAEKRAGQWWVARDDLDAVIAEGTGARRRTVESDAEPRELLVEPFIARLLAGDTAGCWDLICDALKGGATPAEVHDRFLQASLEHIGECWARGELSVSDEHRATATASRLLGQMGPLFRHRGRRRGTIVLGAVAGDRHALPSAIMADLLCDRRFDVVDLGANTPTESFLAVASTTDDVLGIGLCVVLDDCVDEALVQVKDLRVARPDLCLVIGGPAIARSSRRADFDEVVDLVSTATNEACEYFESIGARPRVLFGSVDA